MEGGVYSWCFLDCKIWRESFVKLSSVLSLGFPSVLGAASQPGAWWGQLQPLQNPLFGVRAPLRGHSASQSSHPLTRDGFLKHADLSLLFATHSCGKASKAPV